MNDLYSHYIFQIHFAAKESGMIQANVGSPSLPVEITCSINDVASAFKKFLKDVPGGILGSLSLFTSLRELERLPFGLFTDPDGIKEQRNKLVALAFLSVPCTRRIAIITCTFGTLACLKKDVPKEPGSGMAALPDTGSNGHQIMTSETLATVFAPLLLGDLTEEIDPNRTFPAFLTPRAPKETPRKSYSPLKHPRRYFSRSDGQMGEMEKINMRINKAKPVIEFLLQDWTDIVKEMNAMERSNALLQLPDLADQESLQACLDMNTKYGCVHDSTATSKGVPMIGAPATSTAGSQYGCVHGSDPTPKGAPIIGAPATSITGSQYGHVHGFGATSDGSRMNGTRATSTTESHYERTPGFDVTPKGAPMISAPATSTAGSQYGYDHDLDATPKGAPMNDAPTISTGGSQYSTIGSSPSISDSEAHLLLSSMSSNDDVFGPETGESSKFQTCSCVKAKKPRRPPPDPATVPCRIPAPKTCHNNFSAPELRARPRMANYERASRSSESIAVRSGSVGHERPTLPLWLFRHPDHAKDADNAELRGMLGTLCSANWRMQKAYDEVKAELEQHKEFIEKMQLHKGWREMMELQKKQKRDLKVWQHRAERLKTKLSEVSNGSG